MCGHIFVFGMYLACRTKKFPKIPFYIEFYVS
nr:MAG TPA: hypothetical protein [Caudoviricetes sp.]DAV94552.1 MAG TPA: hypothetical protein [Caudoviricetes sp.]